MAGVDKHLKGGTERETCSGAQLRFAWRPSLSEGETPFTVNLHIESGYVVSHGEAVSEMARR